jgi:ABC-type dipeptide/oligopeptide/nickel transport system permease component
MSSFLKNAGFFKRLFVALSIIWIFISFVIGIMYGYNDFDGFSRGAFIIAFLIASMPVWMSWLIYWVYKGSKKTAQT